MTVGTLDFCSSARDPSGLMVGASDEYSEGLGFESQLDPKFFSWIYFLNKNIINYCTRFLLINKIVRLSGNFKGGPGGACAPPCFLVSVV